MNNNNIDDTQFYLAFENAHRGSEEETLNKQFQYLPIVQLLEEQGSESKMIDIGCGRGEWLKALSQRNWHVTGVDLDQQMVETCKDKGLEVSKKSALNAFKEIKDSSLDLITSFHVIEHIEFNEFLHWLKEAKRVLKPHGIIILETPNIECPQVSQYYFRMDPTHINPLPAGLLEFSAKHTAFASTNIVRLNGPKIPAENDALAEWLKWWQNANPDVALIASNTHSTALQHAVAQIGSQVEHHSKFYEFVGSLQNKQRLKLESQQAQLESQHQWLAHLQEKAELQEHKTNRMWQAFAPIRLPIKLFKHIKNQGLKSTLKKTILKLAPFILARPVLKQTIIRALNKMPWLNSRIRALFKRQESTKTTRYHSHTILSPRAQQIFDALSGKEKSQ